MIMRGEGRGGLIRGTERKHKKGIKGKRLIKTRGK